MKRAALYARVSGDDRGKDGRNLAGQLEMCHQYARERGWEIVGKFSEDSRGASGAEIDLPELNKIRDLAAAGGFDVLVVRELDRLSRNLAKQLIVEEQLRRAGVTIEYVLGMYPDTPEGNFMKHVRAAVAELEREKIAERMTRGRYQKVKAGHVVCHGRPPYGYKLGEVDGKRTLIPHEQEAEVVRLIFDLYLNGDGENGSLSIRAISRHLSDLGILTKGDTDKRVHKVRARGKWNRGAVWRILNRETYTGVFHYGRMTRTEKGSWVETPRETWVSVEVPAIITREQWKAVQKQFAINKADARRNTRNEYLLRRRAICPECGSKMFAKAMTGRRKKRFYYRCLSAVRSDDYVRTCSQTRGFPAERVDAAIWQWVKKLLTNPEAALASYQEEQDKRDDAAQPLRDRLRVIGDLLADNRRQLDKALDLYLTGGIPREMLTERTVRLQTTIDALENERADLEERIEAETISDQEIKSFLRFTQEIAKGLEDADHSFAKRRWLINKLDLTAHLTIEDGKAVTHVSCRAGSGPVEIASTSTH